MLVNRTLYAAVCLSISSEILAKLLRCWRRQHYAAEKISDQNLGGTLELLILRSPSVTLVRTKRLMDG